MMALAASQRGAALGVLAALVIAPAVPAAATAAVIPVNTTADTIAVDGACSLREAVAAANADAPSGAVAGECPAGSGADIVKLGAGTFVRTKVGAGDDLNVTGDLDATGAMTISGAGEGVTAIDGNGAAANHDRVLDVQPAANVAVELLTITNGRSQDGVERGQRDR